MFGFQILQDPNLPDVVIFHNDIRVTLKDAGMHACISNSL